MTRLESLEKLKKAYFDGLRGNKQAQKFLNDRGVSEASIQDFGIGFSSSHIKNNLDEETKNLLSLLGFFNENGNDCNWRRVTFPIYDENGLLLAFNGRKIEDVGESPKFLLPLDSEGFHKSRILFNLNQAKEHIQKEGFVILVEGVFDVIAMHQAGFKNVVCALGSSIRLDQIRLLMRYTDQFVIAYDGDLAGFKASVKTSKLLYHTLSADKGEKIDIKAHVSHVVFKEGIDPGNFLKKPEALNSLVHGAVNGVDFIYSKLKEHVKFKEALKKLKKQAGSVVKKQSPITKQILEQLDIVEVIKHYEPNLKRKGRNYVTKCLLPDHVEKTASMSISPEKQIFKCFGCDCGGNAIKFVQMMEDVTYKEAIIILKERGALSDINLDQVKGLKVHKPKSTSNSLSKKKQALLGHIAGASHYVLMRTEKGAAALDILAQSGITKEMVVEHQIGLALKDRTILANQITFNDPGNELMPLALEMGLMVDNNGVLESQLVGVTKPLKHGSGVIVKVETYTSQNIRELALKLRVDEKKQRVNKEAMAL